MSSVNNNISWKAGMQKNKAWEHKKVYFSPSTVENIKMELKDKYLIRETIKETFKYSSAVELMLYFCLF